MDQDGYFLMDRVRLQEQLALVADILLVLYSTPFSDKEIFTLIANGLAQALSSTIPPAMLLWVLLCLFSSSLL